MQELHPHIKKLKDRHKGDARTLQQETMKLYKEHGINPVAGCLPVLVQLPVIWSLYSVLQQVFVLDQNLVVSQINKIVYFDFLKLTSAWDLYFFGLHLGQTPSKLMSTIGPLVLLVPILTGIFQFVLSKMLIPQKQKPPAGSQKEVEKKEDFMSTFQTQSAFIFPIMIAFFSYTFPIGLSLYWNTFTIFGIIQQYKILGLGGLVPQKKNAPTLTQ